MQGRGIFGELEPERHRQRMLQPGSRYHCSVTMLPRQFGKARDGAVEIPEQRIDRRAQGQHNSGIDHVLAGGAPMHIARGFRVGLGDFRREAKAARSNAPALQAFAIGPAEPAGMTPVAASARASAASKSSMCWRYATSSQIARMAALDSIGASRGESEVLMMRAT